MESTPTAIPGVMIITPRIFNDARGYFFESWSRRRMAEILGHDIEFVQDNESRSVRSVVRGLHFQRPPMAQAKLVRCVAGSVLDVAVDIRRDSPTYGKYVAVELSAGNKLQLFLPRGIAHGFAVLSAEAVFQYKCDNYYAPDSEDGINLFDPTLAIDWPFGPDEAILSDKDRCRQAFATFKSPF